MEELLPVVTSNKNGLYDKRWMIPRGIVSNSNSIINVDYIVTSDAELQSLPDGIYAMYNLTGITPVNYATLIKGSGSSPNGVSSFMVILTTYMSLYYRVKWDKWGNWRQIDTSLVPM